MKAAEKAIECSTEEKVAATPVHEFAQEVEDVIKIC